MDEQPEPLAKVQALGALAGLELTEERAAIVADAIEAFRPLLESLDKLDLDNIRPGATFDAEWKRP